MIRNELKALWNNKLLMVVLLVIILIPAMYAGFFLASMWDPYGDLEYLPVAVVNKDKAVTYEDKELTIGDDLADNLAENDAMAFNVVDEKTAEKGLENGTYYMVVTIPEDFSANAATLMDDTPKQMVLDYETNPGRNYISMKLSESAMKEIKANLTEEITHTYAETVFDSLSEIEDGFADAVDGTDNMLDGEDKLLDGNNAISENLLVLSDGATELKTGTDTLSTGSNVLNSTMPEVTTGADDLADGAAKVSAGVDKLAGGLSGLTGSVNSNIEAQTENQKTYAAKVETDKENVKTEMTAYVTSVAQAVAAQVATDAATTASETVSSCVASSIQAYNSSFLKGTPAMTPEQQTVYAAMPAEEQALLDSYAQAVATQAVTQYAEGLSAALQSDSARQQTALAVENAVNSKMTSPQEQETIGSVALGVSSTAVNDAVGTLGNDAGQLGGATGALQVLTTINAETDLSQLSTLVDGAKEVAKGAGNLADGTKQVSGAVNQIATGSNRLSEGAAKIADGSIQLSDGSLELGEGLVTLQDGTQTLHDALADGKDEISENEASDETLDMFSEPVAVRETKMTEVENNGHAMAAYMFSVGIWVACLAFCLMYPLAKHTGELTNGRDWWASKAVILYPMAILMVIMLMVILHITLGFEPASWFKTILVAFAAVACFMSIMYFFNLLLGKVGSFLMLLFMVLQLAGSAGTYPIEISGKLAQALNKWMPFTYSVNGFRAGIAANGPGVVHECVVLFGISIVFTLLTIGVFRIRSFRTKQGKPFLYDWLEEKGLA